MNSYKDYMTNFSQSDLRGYLGDNIIDLLVEWMPSGDTLLTKRRMISMIDSLYGFSMLKNKQFRKDLLQSMETSDIIGIRDACLTGKERKETNPEIIIDIVSNKAWGRNQVSYYLMKLWDVPETVVDKIVDETIIENEIPPIWDELAAVIIPTIKQMYNQNEETRSKTRTFEETQSPSTDIINTVENDSATTDFDFEEGDKPSEEEATKIGKEELKQLGYEDPTDEQATAFINNSVNFVYADRGERSPAFDYKAVLNMTEITINTSHKFYTSFLKEIYTNPDVQVTFELFLASLMQSVRKTDTYQRDENDRLMTTWYNRLNNYISEQLNPRNIK